MFAPLTFVTVVFDAEIELLRLQAISIARHVSPSGVREIIVIDNTLRGLSHARQGQLMQGYGPFASLVRFLRPYDVGDIVPTTGWRAQQALKLLVSDRIETPWYLALDAKVHFISPTTIDSFFDASGRPKGGIHSYAEHPLLPMLRAVLRYMDVGGDEYETAFTSTTTPFLLRTNIVRELVSDIGSRNEHGFSAEFERARLTEFFLYTAWQLAREHSLKGLTSGESIESPTVWPGHRTAADVSRVLSGTRDSAITTLAIHRTALARLDATARAELAQFWCEHELFASLRQARAFIRRFRRSYYPAMVRKKVRELGERTPR